METAVIKTGGKQYVVREGQRIKVEKVTAKKGEKLALTDVLLVATDKGIEVGAPYVSGASVESKVVRHGQSKKVTGVKMKAKKRQKHYFGHRQEFTEIEINQINDQIPMSNDQSNPKS